MANKEAGHKAYETRIAKFGPDEQRRAGRQAAWTKEYGDTAENPHTREISYPAADRDRWKKFDTWKKPKS